MKYIIFILSIAISCSSFAQTKKLKGESNHSTVGFKISISGFSVVSGKFNDYALTMDWNDEDLTASNISATIKVNSIDTGIADRDTHLLTADFFNAETFPEIIFKSESIKKIDYSHYEAHGTLSMHGTTKDFVLPFQIVKMDGNTIGIRSRTSLNRLDYGVGSEFKHTTMPDFLSDTIEVEIDFWTKKRKE